jgi:hypothetical protein
MRVFLAHTLGAGGPDLEFLLSAVALLVFGLIGYFQKIMKPAVAVLLVLGAVGLAIGAFAVTPDSQPAADDITVEIEDPTDGSTVDAGEPFALQVALEGASLTTKVTSDDPTEGHIHIYVDGKVVSMPSTLTPEVELRVGPHTIAVEYVTAEHAPLDPPVIDEIDVTAE